MDRISLSSKKIKNDRISQLPQPIQHHILNFLEEVEVGRTACLSKEWRSIVQSRPVLVFDGSFAPGSNLKSLSLKSKESLLINHVEKSMQRIIGLGLSIQRFSLRATFYGPDLPKADLDRWMQQLVEARVRDCSLFLHYSSDLYMLPPVVLSSKTLTNLRLSGCNLGQCNNVSLPNLIELTLEKVSLRKEMIHEFTSGCPNLEIMKLVLSSRLSRIHVSGLPKLHTFVLDPLFINVAKAEVKIVAPKLRVFDISNSYRGKIDLIACESSLRMLRLNQSYMTKEDLESLVSRFLGLEELELLGLHVVSIQIPNRKLRVLKVSWCDFLERIDIDAPNLRMLEYINNKLPFYSVNSSFYPNDTIDFYASFDTEPNSWRESLNLSHYLKDMFLKFSKVKNMKLIITFGKEIIVCEELDEYFIKTLYNVKLENPKIEVVRITSYESMADYLFKMRRCLGTITITSRDQESNKKLLEVLRKKTLKDNEGSTYCFKCGYRKCRKPVLYHVEEIFHGETTKTSKIFESFDAMGYEIACIKLEWISK